MSQTAMSRRKPDFKKASNNLMLFILKVIVGLVVGLVISLIGKELFDYGEFSQSFIMIVFCMCLLKVSKKWNYFGLGIFSLFCVLVGILLKMYIQLAPGA